MVSAMRSPYRSRQIENRLNNAPDRISIIAITVLLFNIFKNVEGGKLVLLMSWLIDTIIV